MQVYIEAKSSDILTSEIMLITDVKNLWINLYILQVYLKRISGIKVGIVHFHNRNICYFKAANTLQVNSKFTLLHSKEENLSKLVRFSNIFNKIS